MAAPEPKLVVLVARGTRGDVGAIVSLACRWAREASGVVEVKVITHGKLLAEGDIALACQACGVTGARIEASPGLDADADQEQAAAAGKRRRVATEQETRALAAHLLQECRGAAMVVYNLFALEGHALAERLGVPGVAASPFVIARAPPAAFAARLQEAFPALVAALHAADDEGATRGEDTGEGAGAGEGAGQGPGSVAYRDVDHWMWRLFLDDVGDFRCALGLPPCPLLDAQERILQPLPRATTLLVGASPTLVTRSAFWPRSVRLCGFWPLDLTEPLAQKGLAPTSGAISAFVERTCGGGGGNAEAKAGRSARGPVFVGFGSMDELGALTPQESRGLARAVVAGVCSGGGGGGGGGGQAVVLQAHAGSPYHCELKRLVEQRCVRACVPQHGTPSRRAALPDAICPAPSPAEPPCTPALLPLCPCRFPSACRGGGALSLRRGATRGRRCRGRWAVGRPQDTAADGVLRHALAPQPRPAHVVRRSGEAGEAGAACGPGRVLLVTEPVAHAWLFPRCSVVVHHGGAGTVHTALLAGTPQVIVPHIFDQFSWAERLHYKGLCGPPLASAKVVTPEAIRAAVAFARTAGVGRATDAASRALGQEDGAGAAVEALAATLLL